MVTMVFGARGNWAVLSSPACWPAANGSGRSAGTRRRVVLKNGPGLCSDFSVSAGQRVVWTTMGVQGVAGSNPVIPTAAKDGWQKVKFVDDLVRTDPKLKE